ncbi:hypothetical protein D2E90_18255 [Mycobacteroides abscessus]|nr:hypothetical protein D2E90_18255 [Mycobacteroides abscessus]
MRERRQHDPVGCQLGLVFVYRLGRSEQEGVHRVGLPAGRRRHLTQAKARKRQDDVLRFVRCEMRENARFEGNILVGIVPTTHRPVPADNDVVATTVSAGKGFRSNDVRPTVEGISIPDTGPNCSGATSARVVAMLIAGQTDTTAPGGTTPFTVCTNDWTR